jgi:hypothetical protein
MIIECEYCHKKITNLQTIKVLERKGGKLTGKEFLLCPTCYKRFAEYEINFLDLDKEKKHKIRQWIKRQPKIN